MQAGPRLGVSAEALEVAGRPDWQPEEWLKHKNYADDVWVQLGS